MTSLPDATRPLPVRPLILDLGAGTLDGAHHFKLMIFRLTGMPKIVDKW